MNRISSRHWAFIGLALVVVLAMLSGVKPGTTISPDTQAMYNYIDSLPSGSIVMFSFDHEASALPEIRPLALALLRHAFAKGDRVVGIALLAEGTAAGYRMMELTATEYHKEYGKDYVFLGFKPQYQAAILSMGESIPKTFPRDYLGKSIDSLEVMRGVVNYGNLAGVVSISDGNIATHWIEYGHARFNVPISAAVTAAMVTSYDPYRSSGQLAHMLSGLRGAAEYEQLMGMRGGGQRGMLAQSMAHLYLLALIVIGNIIYFRSRGSRGNVVTVGTIVAGILTLAVLTFLYRDNPIYKFAEYLLVGVAIGYALVIAWNSTIIDLLVNPLGAGGRNDLWIPLILGLMMFARFHPKTAPLSRIPLAILIGSGAGAAIPAMLGPRILTQLSGTVSSVVGTGGLSLVNGLIVVAGLVCTLSYFYFSHEQKGALGRLSYVGTYFLMIFFGTTFGYTVMSRMSTFIGRVEFLLVDLFRIAR